MAHLCLHLCISGPSRPLLCVVFTVKETMFWGQELFSLIVKFTLLTTLPFRSPWPLAHVVQPPPWLSSGTFSCPRKETLSRRAVSAPSRPSPALAAASLFPVPVALPLLEAPQKRNHTLCGLLSLASVTGPPVARGVRAAARVRPSYFSRLGDTPPCADRASSVRGRLVVPCFGCCESCRCAQGRAGTRWSPVQSGP